MLGSVVSVAVLDQGTDWAAWITAISTAITTVVLLVTARLALRSLGDARRTRHGQLVVELSKRWDDPTTRATLQDYGGIQNAEITALIDRLFGGERAPTKQDLEAFDALTAYPNLIDAIGVLHSEGVISSELIRKMWGPLIVSQWRGWEEPTSHLRRYDVQGADATYLYFEAVANEMLRLDGTGRDARGGYMG